MIAIIGAGPAGLYAAYLLAKKGKEVNVYEEHNSIGNPIQCTGIVTSSIKDIIKLKSEFIVNKTKKAKIIAPDGNSVEFNLKNENIILDRQKFDAHFACLAEQSGARIFLGHKFIGCNKNEKEAIILDEKTKKSKNINAEILIGADGPNSQVAKSAGLFGKRQFYVGIQARVKIRNNPDVFEVNLGNISPEFFAWSVPENENIARIGLAVKKNPSFYFNNLLKFKNINPAQIIDKQAGLIPVYNPGITLRKNNIYLLGDAATQVKATTGGGIVHGLLAAGILANSILKNSDYGKECKKRINKDLITALMIRKVLNKMGDKDYSRIIEIFSKEKNKKILEEFDRDYPSKFLTKLLFSEPKLLYFAKKLL